MNPIVLKTNKFAALEEFHHQKIRNGTDPLDDDTCMDEPTNVPTISLPASATPLPSILQGLTPLEPCSMIPLIQQQLQEAATVAPLLPFIKSAADTLCGTFGR